MKTLVRKLIVLLLMLEARMVLKKFRPKIVAITGSVGKTSTKDAAGAIFSHFTNARASKKSMNSEFGVPLTILGRPSGWNSILSWCAILAWGLRLIVFPYRYPEWLVLEVGADHPGDIQKLTRWLRPDVTIITQLSKVPVHVEFFDSPQAVAREKRYLAEALKEDGLLVLNYDDEDVRAFKEAVRRRTITYGFQEGADVVAGNVTTVYNDATGWPEGVTFKIEHRGSTIPITVHNTVGISSVFAVLAAAAAGAGYGFNTVEIGQGIDSYVPPAGRMRLLSGIKNTLIIDDSYNSSPIAVERALSTLGDLMLPGRRIVALGDMLELGKHTAQAHKDAGRHAADVADILITVGPRSRDTARAAIEVGMDENMVLQFTDSQTAGKYCEHLLEAGDTVFAKGSQGVRMEKFVEEIMAHPERKERFLVRQDEAWQDR